MPASRCDTLRGSRELGNERDPLIGNQDGTFDFTIPKRPIRRKITGLPAFTTLKGALISSFPELRHSGTSLRNGDARFRAANRGIAPQRASKFMSTRKDSYQGDADALPWHKTLLSRTRNFRKVTHRLCRFCQPLGRLRPGVNTP